MRETAESGLYNASPPKPGLFFLSSQSCSDFGYYRAVNSSECVEQPELQGHSLEFCLHGRKEQLQTSGYCIVCHSLLFYYVFEH